MYDRKTYLILMQIGKASISPSILYYLTNVLLVLLFNAKIGKALLIHELGNEIIKLFK